jgi:hypothetical protein
MKKIIAVAVFVLCFGASRAQAQRMTGPVGGGSNGSGGNGGAASSASAGGGGAGGGAIPGVTHHPVWVPPPNVSAKNDGEFEPSSFESYDKAVELGKAEARSLEQSVAAAARMAQEQRATATRARIIVQQDVEGHLQEVKTRP